MTRDKRVHEISTFKFRLLICHKKFCAHLFFDTIFDILEVRDIYLCDILSRSIDGIPYEGLPRQRRSTSRVCATFCLRDISLYKCATSDLRNFSILSIKAFC